LAREAATEGGVFVASRPSRLPRSLAKIDLNPSPKHRINRAFAAFFGLDSVILETPSRGQPRARAGRRGGARQSADRERSLDEVPDDTRGGSKP
jgi:hypothetical protein